MRVLEVILTVLGIAVLAIFIGCANEDEGEAPEAQIPPPPSIQNENSAPIETPAVGEAVQYSGDDQDGLLEQWRALGEDETDISLAIRLREELGMMLLTEWHIAQISVGTEESYETSVEAGDYRIQVVGGRGLEGLYLYIVDPNMQVEGEYIAYNEDTGKSPLIVHTFDQAQTIKLIIKPALFEEGASQAWYAWFVMVPQD